MFQVDQPTAATSLPAPAAAGPQGYFTVGNPGSGVPATILDADFMNMVMLELTNVVAAGGLTPSKTTYNQVLTAVKSLSPGVIGQSRNLLGFLTGAAASAPWTAIEIVVESALGGLRYCLANYNQTLNLATTGAGGMDTGAAPTSGYVAVYAIYNPTSNTQSILGFNATSAVAPEVYGGAHMPAGYTASALIGVIPTNSSAQFPPFIQNDRAVSIVDVNAITSTTQVSSLTSVSLAAVVPPNAKSVNGNMSIAGTSIVQPIVRAASSTSGVGSQELATGNGTSGTLACPFSRVPMFIQQTVFWTAIISSGTFNSAALSVHGYEF